MRSIILVLLILAGVSSCTGSDKVITNTSTPEPNKGLILILELEKETYQGDEPIVATLILKNVGITRVLVNNRMWPVAQLGRTEIRDVSFTLTDSSGTEYDYNKMHQLVRTTDKNFVELTSLQGILSGFYELHEMFEPSINLEGKYYLQAYYGNQKDPSDGRIAWKGSLESNVVEFFYAP